MIGENVLPQTCVTARQDTLDPKPVVENVSNELEDFKVMSYN